MVAHSDYHLVYVVVIGNVAVFLSINVIFLSADDAQGLRDALLFSVLMVVLAALITGAVMYPLLVRLTQDLARQSQAVLQGNIELLEVMGEVIARRDADTHIHNYRVTLRQLVADKFVFS